MMFKIALLVTLASIALSAPTKSENYQPSDIMDIADWTRRALFYNSERVERVFDDSITINDYGTWYRFKMDVLVKQLDGSSYVSIDNYLFIDQELYT